MSKPRILVNDRGSFLPFAQALAGDAEVLYYSEWREVASESRNALVGRDFPGIERVDSFYNYIDDVDAIAFPDVGDGDMQHWLRQKGYPVWGCGRAEMLELDRWQFKQLLKKLDMPVAPTRRVIGLDALEEILRKENDLYIKTSFFRGDLESFHHVTWDLSEWKMAKLRRELGPHGREIELLVEEPVKASEIGYDGYCIDGVFPKHACFGLEQKDEAYIGYACAAKDMPKCIRVCNEAMEEPLRKLGMRGNYSNEIRVTDDGEYYLSDPTTRCPSPPISAHSLWITNWAEIVLEGANGRLMEPEFAAPYAAEIELNSPWLETDWLALKIPEEVLPWVRLRRAYVMEGTYYGIPHSWLDIAGSAVGLGPTPDAAIDAALSVAEQVEGLQLNYPHHVKEEILKSWEEAKETCEVKIAA